ncbi:MAG TPA: ABC transporter substrate-binding protein, partial [Bradyrhizobium sp.]|nr:ABC transporter substrate-binding protein [Bradyrhizobium sp.]
MRTRREFITLLGGAAVAWPVAARAQQPTMPIVGFIGSQSSDSIPDYLRALRQGLTEAGFIEGETVGIEYRWADNQVGRLPELAADLVRRRVAIIVSGGGPASMAAGKATTSIPIVFLVAEDPVRLGLVASLARPGNNATGINFFSAELAAKRLELLRELVPGATRVGVLLNPTETAIAAANLRDVETAARAMGLDIRVLNASNRDEIDAAYATFAGERPDALFISSGPFFPDRRVQMAHLATRYALPAIHGSRLYAEVGGLISYGANIAHAYRQAGTYAGRVLKGV